MMRRRVLISRISDPLKTNVPFSPSTTLFGFSRTSNVLGLPVRTNTPDVAVATLFTTSDATRPVTV
jgi:hypothetical protein